MNHASLINLSLQIHLSPQILLFPLIDLSDLCVLFELSDLSDLFHLIHLSDLAKSIPQNFLNSCNKIQPKVIILKQTLENITVPLPLHLLLLMV